MEGLGMRLKAARLAKGFTQAYMADHVCVCRSAYTKYELGETEPSLETMVKIMEVLDVSPYELLAIRRKRETPFGEEKRLPWRAEPLPHRRKCVHTSRLCRRYRPENKNKQA